MGAHEKLDGLSRVFRKECFPVWSWTKTCAATHNFRHSCRRPYYFVLSGTENRVAKRQ